MSNPLVRMLIKGSSETLGLEMLTFLDFTNPCSSQISKLLYRNAMFSGCFKNSLTRIDILSGLKKGEGDYENLTDEITYFGPDFILCLGAKASSHILKAKQRLSNVHGSYITRTITYLTGGPQIGRAHV